MNLRKIDFLFFTFLFVILFFGFYEAKQIRLPGVFRTDFPLQTEIKTRPVPSSPLMGENNHPTALFSERMRNILQTVRSAFGFPITKLDPKVKIPEPKFSLVPKDNQTIWAEIKKLGFEFGKVPNPAQWKATKKDSPREFFAVKNPIDNSQLIFAAVPKEQGQKYSENLKDYFSVAENLTGRVSREFFLPSLKIANKGTEILQGTTRLLKVGLSGYSDSTGVKYKSVLLFFQTPSHFVGAYGVFKNDNFSRMEKMLNQMFQSLFFGSRLRQFSRTAKRAEAGGIKTETVEQVPIAAKQTVRKATVQKRKPWEEAEKNPDGENLVDTAGDFQMDLPMPDQFEFCKTCGGKAICSNAQCEGGFTICEICRDNPPPKCKKCNGTGLRRTDNPYTRLESWEHCDRCIGTGKEFCQNRCLGGKLKCTVCGGRGRCSVCRGRGWITKR